MTPNPEMPEMPDEIWAAQGKDGTTYWVRHRHEALDKGDAIKQTRFVRADRPAAVDVNALKDIVSEAMQDKWNDWCADTGCFPDDFTWKGGNGTLWFQASKWASNVGEAIWHRLHAHLTPAPIPEGLARLNYQHDLNMIEASLDPAKTETCAVERIARIRLLIEHLKGEANDKT